MSGNPRGLYEFGPFRLDIAERQLLRDGLPVPLTPKVFDLLVVLVTRGGHLIEKDDLMKAVWADSNVEESNLSNNIYELRKTLGDGEDGRLYIQTAPKRGYRFAAPVRELSPVVLVEKRSVTSVIIEEESEDDGDFARNELTVAGGAQSVPPARAARATLTTSDNFGSSLTPRRHWKSPLRWLVIASCGLVLVAATWLFARSYFARAEAGRIGSIAVMPFRTESGNPESEYWSDGMTESIINSLSRLPQLKVIARSSVFEYKGKEIKPREVARTLGVQAILTGRVAERGDSLVVSVELMDARDGTQVWGEQYTRKASDLQGGQDDIALMISEKLRVKLTGALEQQLTKRATANPEAYELYLRGLLYFRKPGLEGIRKALTYFDRAVELDPNFALAWIGVARVHRFFAGNSLLDPKEPLARAKAATQRALALDESLAEAHATLAGIKQDEWDWSGAELEYKRAIALSPNLADARSKYSSYLSLMERPAEALDEVKRAQELDPLRIGLRFQEASALYLARRYAEAIAKAEEVLDLTPEQGMPHFGLGLMYAGNGMYERAIHEYQKAISIIGETTSVRCYLGFSLARSGKRGQAKTILNRLKTNKEYVSPTELAVLYVGLGDKEGAVASLERAYAARDLQLPTLKVDPHFDELRADPRFQDLLRRVKLAP